ncbi:MAG: FAD-dependent oxidoreductase [Solirubrobacterales bacterium]|nr:FAD-dependent oxidoreductase [Solirubrobacterales bacterium]
MAVRDVDHLLIGGGLASANCARWLRESGAEGEILLVGREPDPPYNRPNCSKGFLRGIEERQEAHFRPGEWWVEQRIELLERTSVTALDPATRTARLSNREEVRFGSALVATGANVRRLNAPGAELEGIHYLRTLANSLAIREEAAQADHVVMIGGSYISSEVAASLTTTGNRCTIVMQEELTLERSFGPRAGRFFHDLLASKGIEIHGRDELARFEGEGRVARVVTRNGLELDADLVVIGAGVLPEVHLARGAGLELGESGGVRCSAQLESSAPGVYCAGDMCQYDSPLHGEAMRIEHWDVAFTQGKTAALNMLGGRVAHEVVPYFFSVLGDWAELEYVGPARSWDRELVRGSLEEGSFTIWYLREGRLAGALTVGRPADLDDARRMLVSRAQLDDDAQRRLVDPDSDLAAIAS